MSELKVYNFLSQDVYPLKFKPHVFCCTENKLIVAYSSPSGRIDVFDLNENCRLIQRLFLKNVHTEQVIFCEFGNYIGVLSKHATEDVQVKVIINWWIQGKPMELRVAGKGRVSSKPFNSGRGVNIELLDFPLDDFNFLTLKSVDCCQKTGNLVLCYGQLISLYQYTKNHSKDGKILYTDFIHLLDVRTSFIASKVKLSENNIALMCPNHVQVLRLTLDTDSCETIKKPNATTPSITTAKWAVLPSLSHKLENNYPQDWQHPLQMLGPLSNTLCCKVEAVVCHVNSHITKCDPEVLLCAYGTHQDSLVSSNGCPLDLSFITIYASETIFDPLSIESKTIKQDSTSPLTSDLYESILAFGFLLASRNRAILYSVRDVVQPIHEFVFDYNVLSVVIESTVIHVLGDSTLEVYSHSMLEKDPVFSSSFAPLKMNRVSFMEPERIMDAGNYLLLFCKNASEAQEYTVYALRKPLLKDIYFDTIEVCDNLDTSTKIGVLQNLILSVKSCILTNPSKEKELEPTILKILFIFAESLISKYPSVSTDSIVRCVFSDHKVSLAQIVNFQSGSKDLRKSFFRFKLGKSDIHECLNLDAKTVVDVVNLLRDEKQLVAKFLLKCSFSTHEMSTLNIFEHIDFQGLSFVKAKLFLELDENEKLQEVLEEDNRHEFVEDLVSCRNVILPLNETLVSLFNSCPSYFIDFLVRIVTERIYSVKYIYQTMNIDPNLGLLFLDSIYWHHKRFHDPTLLEDLVDGYIEKLTGKENCSLLMHGRFSHTSSFIRLLVPSHKENATCLCRECLPEYEKLLFIVFTESNEKVRIMARNSFQGHEKFYMLSILAEPFTKCLEAFLEMNHSIALAFISDPLNTQPHKWESLYRIVEKKFNADKNVSPLMQQIFYNLAENIPPQDFLGLITPVCKNTAMPYLKMCLKKHEAQKLKHKIVKLGQELKNTINSQQSN